MYYVYIKKLYIKKFSRRKHEIWQLSILILIEWIPSVKFVWIASFCIKYNCFVLLKANSEHPLLFVWEDHYFLLLNFSRPILSSKCLSLIVIWQLQKKILICSFYYSMATLQFSNFGLKLKWSPTLPSTSFKIPSLLSAK